MLEDKKICRIVSDEKCVMCGSRVGENVAHFLVGWFVENLREIGRCRWMVCAELWGGGGGGRGGGEWFGELRKANEESIAVRKRGGVCMQLSNGGSGSVRR